MLFMSKPPFTETYALFSSLTFEKSMQPMLDKEFFQLAAKYKFALTMENSVCNDYITEKVWRPLILGSVPVIFGSPKIKVRFIKTPLNHNTL